MKLLARMNRVVRISTIAVILCVALTGGSLIYKHSTAHACGSNIIPASTTLVIVPSGSNFATVIFSLWYNSCNQQNFTSANITQNPVPNLIVSVVRNSGPDGGLAIMQNTSCRSTGICTSPGIYSPDNTSFASINTRDAYTISSSSF